MATLTAPGVYVEEVSSGVRPIQAAGTSTAAFFGEAERGPTDSVVKVFNFTEFQTYYGTFLNGGRFLAHSVFQFFNNGGSACYVGRVVNALPAEAPDTASVTVLDRGAVAQPALTFAASSPGGWGNGIMVVVNSAVSTDPDNQFNLSVYQDNPVAGEPPVLLETYANLTMDPADAGYVETVVNGGSTYLRVTANIANANEIRGFSQGAEIIVDGVTPLLGATQRDFQINLNGDGWRTVDLTAALGAANLTVPENIRAAIQTAITGMDPLRASTPPGTYAGTTVAFTTTTGSNGRLTITVGGDPAASSSCLVQDALVTSRNAAGALGLGAVAAAATTPLARKTAASGSANQRPQNTAALDFYFLGDDTVGGAVSAVVRGDDGGTPQDSDYILAFNRLDLIRDVSLVAVPGIGSVVSAGMNYCANRQLSDCFYIGDMEATDDSYLDAVAFRATLTAPNSYGSVYFPWLRMVDLTGASPEPLTVPPSGFIAGLYSRIDGRRGVWKAPAGTEAILGGAVGMAADLGEVQHGDLNNHPLSIAVIRKFPTTGIVAWGARTVSSDPEYKYIPVRRMAIFLRVSIYNGIQWAVFEPNDEPLWASLRLNITSFMNTLFRRGAFQGATPSQAFFVKVDSETTTQADIDLGIVNVLIGFAPLKPAEFVVVRISQKAGQTG